jgi:hypothetical protein
VDRQAIVTQKASTESIKRLALSLFVLGILADDADASLSLDDFALLANRFY